MIKKYAICGVVFLVIGLVLINIGLSPIIYPETVTVTETPLIGAFSLSKSGYEFRTVYLNRGDTIKFNFLVVSISISTTGDKGVDFFITDEENFKTWASGKGGYLYYRLDRTNGASGEFKAPHSGNWYLVWSDTFNPQVIKTVSVTTVALKTMTIREELRYENLILSTVGLMLLVAGAVLLVYGSVVKKGKAGTPTNSHVADLQPLQ